MQVAQYATPTGQFTPMGVDLAINSGSAVIILPLVAPSARSSD
jgi:hypothetical protein